MINILLVDDDLKFVECIVKELKDFFIKYDYAYKIHTFREYNDEFFKFASISMENKLYLLDIETALNNGIDVARKIRRFERDSDILFLTAHDKEDYKNKIVTNNIKSMGFIYKGNVKEEFSKKMEEFLANVVLQDAILFDDGTYHYVLPLRDILYVTTDKLKRKTVVYTISGLIELSLSLHEVEQMLLEKSNFFIKVHRSYIVNLLRIISINLAKRTILFSNHEEIQAISRKYKQQFVEAWNRYNTTDEDTFIVS